jgi:methionyl-tRNA synthetase
MAIADRINGEFDTAQPWLLAKDPARGAELQDVCSRALHGFQVLSILLAPVLPALAVASRASCSAATASSRGRTSTTCRRASRRTST